MGQKTYTFTKYQTAPKWRASDLALCDQRVCNWFTIPESAQKLFVTLSTERSEDAYELTVNMYADRQAAWIINSLGHGAQEMLYLSAADIVRIFLERNHPRKCFVSIQYEE